MYIISKPRTQEITQEWNCTLESFFVAQNYGKYKMYEGQHVTRERVFQAWSQVGKRLQKVISLLFFAFFFFLNKQLCIIVCKHSFWQRGNEKNMCYGLSCVADILDSVTKNVNMAIVLNQLHTILNAAKVTWFYGPASPMNLYVSPQIYISHSCIF